MTISSTPLTGSFQRYAEHQVARVLTQMDRDPDSPTFGCFDRNYWHYKIRDFPSSILQQGVFTLDAIRKGSLPCVSGGDRIELWCIGAINALGRQVDRLGRVDEYYPFEAGYPPAAFGMYAAGRLLVDWRDQAPDLVDGVNEAPLQRLAGHLASRTERGAANQQAAGLAGLALAAKAGLSAAPGPGVENLAAKTFAAQHEEGWFNEYGGPDFGYLSVTLDALVDYHDASGDDRALAAIDRAVDFLAAMIGVDGRLPSTLNSRNTDYVVPYGLVRAAEWNGTSAWLVHTLFADMDKPGHFLWSTDDRYHCHYIFASIVRSLSHLDRMRSPVPPHREQSTWLDGCGFWVYRSADELWTAYVAGRKGGLVRIHRGNGLPPLLDHGWRVTGRGQMWTTNWWSADWTVEHGSGRIRLRGNCRRTPFHVPSPLKHIVLRLLAYVLRQRLIPLLKRTMIFRPSGSGGPAFERVVKMDDEGISIEDRFEARSGAVAAPGPRQNLRHVASADSFSHEELQTRLFECGPVALDKPQTVRTDWTSSDEQHSA